MISRSLALGLVAVGCLAGAAGGSYVAVRHNSAEPQRTTAVVQPVPAAASQGVQETEAVVTPDVAPVSTPVVDPIERRPAPPAQSAKRPTLPPATPTRRPKPVQASATRGTSPLDPVPALEPVRPPAPEPSAPPAPEPVGASATSVATPHRPVQPVEPVLEEIVLPAASVIGLELESTVTTERARVEDRVDARVTRDVYADGRLAIPAGSRVIGAVSLVERGGKVKERARLGVRFHTLVLAGGRQVELRTETIYRDGESPANDSSKKIGGAAIGGAVLGAILGGGKGAIAGATAGAAGGTAVVMAGDRKAATLASGSVVTVKLSSPVALEVER